MGQLEDMHAFIRIVEAGGIGKAADQLNTAKSAVSRRLVELENRLGVKLINRTTRSINLTDAGRTYYTRALKVLDDVTELNSLTSDGVAQLAGSIRLSVPVSFGMSHLSAAIDKFIKLHPSVEFDISFSDRHIDLIEEGVDLALRISELKDSSLIARRICPVSIYLAASPSYLETHGTPTTLEELKHHKLLKYLGSSSGTVRIQDLEKQEHMIPMQVSMHANNGDFLMQMAKAGHGIISSPAFICWDALKTGELVKILSDYTVPPINAYAVYPANRYLSQRARIFIAFLKEHFGETPYWEND